MVQSLRGLFGGSGSPASTGATPSASPAAAPSAVSVAPSGGIDHPIRGPRARVWSAGRDVIDCLPEPARLQKQRDRKADVAATVQRLAEEQYLASQAKLAAEAALRSLQNWRSASASRGVSGIDAAFPGRLSAGPVEHHLPPVRPSAARLAEAEKEVSDAKRRCDEIAERIAAKQAELHPLDALVANLERFISSIAGSEILEPHRENRKTQKAATPDDLKAVRQRIVDYKAEINTVRSAPPPKADIKARARAQIERMATAGALDYRAAIQFSSRDIGFPQTLISFSTLSPAGAGAASIYVPMPNELICWLFLDQILARIEADIDKLASDEGALSDVEKQKRETEIRSLLLQAERDEENIIDQLEQASTATIQRRPDADPRAVLGLSSDLPMPA